MVAARVGAAPINAPEGNAFISVLNTSDTELQALRY